MTVVYMKVSKDEYELPEAIADSPMHLAKMLGVKPQSIYDSMRHVKTRGSWSPYKKVEFDEEEDDD